MVGELVEGDPRGQKGCPQVAHGEVISWRGSGGVSVPAPPLPAGLVQTWLLPGRQALQVICQQGRHPIGILQIELGDVHGYRPVRHDGQQLLLGTQ